MKALKITNVDALLSATGDFRHILHLYSSDINKYAVQAPFLATADGESAVYVTNDDPKVVEKEFNGLDVNLTIIRPEEIVKTLVSDRGSVVVVDGDSISFNDIEQMEGRTHGMITKYFNPLQRERYLTGNCGAHNILCTYAIGSLSSEMVKQLATFHEKLILTTSDTTLLASASFDKICVSQEAVQRFVRNELESIVLALLLKEPLCGIDIIRTIHDQFGVLLSPGTIYPMLHDLEKQGLLEYEYNLKIKTYKPTEAVEKKIREMLEENAKAIKFLSNFLQVYTVGEQRNVRSSKNKP